MYVDEKEELENVKIYKCTLTIPNQRSLKNNKSMRNKNEKNVFQYSKSESNFFNP